MKDLGEAYFVAGFDIHRDRLSRSLGFCQKAYIDRILEDSICITLLDEAPIINEDKFNMSQCPEMKLRRKQ